MAFSTIPKQFTDATIKFIDNTPTTPLELDIIHCTGDASIDGNNSHGGGNRALAVYQTRGGSNATNGNTAVRAAAHEPATFGFSMHQYDLSESTTGTMRDWLDRTTGTPYSAAIGFEAADSEVFSFTAVITIGGAALGDAKDQTWTLTRCIETTTPWGEGEPNTDTPSFTCLGTIVRTVLP